MRSTLPLAMLVLALAVPATAQQASRPGETRHSGRIVEVAPDGSAIVLEEMVAWTGPGTGVVTRSIKLTPRTSIRLLERTARWEDDRSAMPGWDAQVIEASSLRRGDFVTVTTDDRRTVAVALQVIRPAAE